MEVKIGVQHAPRELLIESAESPDEVERSVHKALTSPNGMLALSDSNGRKVLVPADRLAYVEIGEPVERRVGFGTL